MLFYQATIKLCGLASLQCDVHHAVLLQQEVSLITFKNQRFITSHITSRWFISLLVYDYAVAQTVTPHPVKLSDSGCKHTQMCRYSRACLSAPRFTLGSASSQTVGSLPGALHQLECLAAAFLHQWIRNVSVRKLNLCAERVHEGYILTVVIFTGCTVALFFLKHTTIHRLSDVVTWKMAFHASSKACSNRSLSPQPLKYKTQGGRNCARSAANSYQQIGE